MKTKVITVCRTRQYNKALQSILNELLKQKQNVIYVDECKISEKNGHPNYRLKKFSNTEKNGREKKISASAAVVKEKQRWIRNSMAMHAYFIKYEGHHWIIGLKRRVKKIILNHMYEKQIVTLTFGKKI